MKKLPEWKDEALLILRLGLGVTFFMHGLQKVFGLFGGEGLATTVENFHKGLGIPPFWGYVATFTELAGGTGLLFGIWTRLFALGISVIMTVAIWKVHLVHGFFLNWSCHEGREHGYEYNLALLAMSLALVLTGGGAYSADKKFLK